MRRRLLDFDLRLSSLVSEESREYDWGRTLLCPSLPLAWDANRIVIERPGISIDEVAAAADEVMGDAPHRTVAVYDDGAGERLAGEAAGRPGWRVERTVYMVWNGESQQAPPVAVAETTLNDCESLRLALIAAEFSPDMERLEETSEQLLELNRRQAAVADGRWFQAPAPAPAAACSLLSLGEIAQIEDVGTLAAARGRGLAQAVTLAALAASREAGSSVTFLAADAEDWPRLMYEKLGFGAVGELLTLRRLPT